MSNFNNRNNENKTLDEAKYIAKLKSSYSSYSNMCELFEILCIGAILLMIIGGVLTLMFNASYIYKFEGYCILVGVVCYIIATLMESKMIYTKTVFEETTGETID